MFTYVIDSAGGDKKYVIHVKFLALMEIFNFKFSGKCPRKSWKTSTTTMMMM